MTTNGMAKIRSLDRDRLRRDSVYVSSESTDGDFAYYVLVDTDADSRSGFLKELHHVLCGPAAPLRFAVGDHREQIGKWVDARQDDPMATPANWLKIAIERYPIRLFVAIDPELWKRGDGLTPLDHAFWLSDDPALLRLLQFFRKRICWLTVSQIAQFLHPYSMAQGESPPPARCDSLALGLYRRWIGHLLSDLRELDRPVLVGLESLRSTDAAGGVDVPPTVPQALRMPPSKDSDSARFLVRHDGTNARLDKGETPGSAYQCSFLRHTAAWVKGKKTPWHCALGDEAGTIYSESLSGVLSYFNRIVDLAQRPFDARAEMQLLLFVEQAVIRTAIIDERTQEWFLEREAEKAGWVFQQRLYPGFLEAPGFFRQVDKSSHGYSCRLVHPGRADGRLLLECPRGSGFEKVLEPDLQADGVLTADLIVIHQGILEKWVNEGNFGSETGSSLRIGKEKRILTRQLLHWKDRWPWLVVCSGRGKPENVPFGVRFLPYSGIESCVVGDCFEKATLFRQFASLHGETRFS